MEELAVRNPCDRTTQDYLLIMASDLDHKLIMAPDLKFKPILAADLELELIAALVSLDPVLLPVDGYKSASEEHAVGPPTAPAAPEASDARWLVAAASISSLPRISSSVDYGGLNDSTPLEAAWYHTTGVLSSHPQHC